ncbi:MAG TPA: glycosyltransferase [Candidatus Binataceae bacterium]|nr:glycosyltransferase [Candidatus Binataceae bacterium]
MLDRSVYGKGNTRAELIWRKSLLKRSLRNPSLRTLFCLDPWSIPYIEKLTSRVSVIALPDPVREYSERADPVHLRRRLGVETGRKLMLFFGELSRRKGTFQLLESLRLLSPADAKRLTVLMAGPIPAADRSLIRSRANRLKNVNICQLIIEDRFVPDHEIQNLFNASDLVIAPYQHHIGMSAVLVRAAMARKPIIGPNHGVLAALIRGQRLGLAVDTSSPVKIANAIGYCLSRPSEELFDRASAIAFAEFNRPEKFTATIFGRLFDGSEGISSMSGNTRTASQCAFFT